MLGRREVQRRGERQQGRRLVLGRGTNCGALRAHEGAPGGRAQVPGRARPTVLAPTQPRGL